jgi:hypothetical protein
MVIFIMDNLKIILNMELVDVTMLINLNIMENGIEVENKDRECLFIRIKMYILGIG